MKKLKYIVLTILLAVLLIPFNTFAEENEIRLYLFHSETCPHCKEEIEYLDTIKDDYPNLDIVKYEVSNNEMNYNFYNKVIKKAKINTGGQVPFTIIGTDYYVGFSKDVKNKIKKSLNKFSTGEYVDIISKIKNDEDISGIKYNQSKNNGGSANIKNEDNSNNTFNIPLIGDVNVKEVSLPFISIVIGFVDGFNPCAMWVLLFLIGMLFNMKDKKKMWILGLTFLGTSALVYLLIMLAWLQVAISFNTSKIIKFLIALVALCAGTINLRSFSPFSLPT